MKAVMISIQPKWCELISKCIGYENRRPLYKKRLDLRKSAPEATPFKAFIYESKGKKVWKTITVPYEQGGGVIDIFTHEGRGQVIGEFICDYVVRHCEMENAYLADEMSCVPREDILKYSNGKEVVGWHISDLKIYDKPRALAEFKRVCDGNCQECKYAIWQTRHPYDDPIIVDCKPISVPQSWCYVEVQG